MKLNFVSEIIRDYLSGGCLQGPSGSPPEDKPLPPKGKPWIMKLLQHLSPKSTGEPPPAQDSLEAEISSPKIIKAGKLKTKKSNKGSDFSDIANWPTPGELVNTGVSVFFFFFNFVLKRKFLFQHYCVWLISRII